MITIQISSESSAGLSSGGQPDYASSYLFPFLPILSPLYLYSWHHIPNSIPANNLCPWLCLWSNCPRHKVGTLISHLQNFLNSAIQRTIFIFSNGRVLSHVQDQVSHLYCQSYYLPYPSGTCSIKHPFSAFYFQLLLST